MNNQEIVEIADGRAKFFAVTESVLTVFPLFVLLCILLIKNKFTDFFASPDISLTSAILSIQAVTKVFYSQSAARATRSLSPFDWQESALLRIIIYICFLFLPSILFYSCFHFLGSLTYPLRIIQVIVFLLSLLVFLGNCWSERKKSLRTELLKDE